MSIFNNAEVKKQQRREKLASVLQELEEVLDKEQDPKNKEHLEQAMLLCTKWMLKIK